MYKVHFKVFYNNEIRRFYFDRSNLNFTTFLQQVKELFNLIQTPKKILYKDQDGDMVTCATNLEFESAISQLPKDSVLVVRIPVESTPKVLEWKKKYSRSWCGEASNLKMGENTSTSEDKGLSSEKHCKAKWFFLGKHFHMWRRSGMWMKLSKEEREKFREKWMKFKEWRKNERCLRKQEKWKERCRMKEERKERRRIEIEKRGNLELLFEDFPKNTSLFVDGSNLRFFNRWITKLSKEGKQVNADEFISKWWKFYEVLKFKELIIVFNETKLTSDKSGIEIKSAKPQFATSKDALVDLAKNLKNTKECLFVTSDWDLMLKLRTLGVKAIRPRKLIRYAMKMTKKEGEVECAIEWLKKLKV